MKELLVHPWVRVLLVATTVAMCSFALRETASVTLPVLDAVLDVLVPVAIGFVIAYVLTPLVDLLSKRSGFGRTVAAAVLFAAAVAAVLGTLAVVVPLLAKQTADLANQIAHGEPLSDRNGNGRWDPGEQFTDQNGNGVYDPSMVSRITDWVQTRQQNLRQMANLAVDDAGLAMLNAYQEEVRIPRLELERILAGGEPTGVVPTDAPTAWSPAWPGPAESEVEAAISHRPKIEPYVCELGRTWAEAQHRVVSALRGMHGGPVDPDLATLADRLREAGVHVLTAEERTAAIAALRHLEDRERAGSIAAKELLTELRGGEATVGGHALALALAKMEGALRNAVDKVPDRIGGWAEGALGSAGAIGGFLIDVLLVPIYAFFLILAMPKVRLGMKEMIPGPYKNDTLRIVRDIERAVSAFFRGRLIICLACALVGVVGFLGLQLFGVKVPYGILFGVLIGLVTPIPMAGIVIAIPAVALTMIQPGAGPLQGALAFAVYGLVQATEAVLIPLVLGREVEIHPVWLIIALLFCGKVLGVLGLILAVPIAATVRILSREYLWPRLHRWAAVGFEAVQPPKPDPALSADAPPGSRDADPPA